MFKQTDKKCKNVRSILQNNPARHWHGIFTGDFLVCVVTQWQANRRTKQRAIKMRMMATAGFTDRNRAAEIGYTARQIIDLRAERLIWGHMVAAHAKDPENLEILNKLVGTALRGRAFITPKLKDRFPIIEKAYRNYLMVGAQWKETLFHDEEWAQSHPLWYILAPHISENDESKLAYTLGLDKLQRDIQVVTRPGRFLTKYFDLPDEQVRDIVHKWEAMAAPYEIEMISNKDPEAWVEAYSSELCASGSSHGSCMTGRSSVRVYAHPKNDLALLVIRSKTSDSVIARAIGHIGNKEYVRAYSDQDEISSNTFESLLDSKGWTRDSGCLEGQKLLRIEGRDGTFVCPYIDGGYQCVEDMGDCLVISDDGLEATNTGGYTDEPGYMCECVECGERVHEEDVTFVESTDGYVCDGCFDNSYVMAVGCGGFRRHYREDCCTYVNGTYYVDDYMDENGIVQCDLSGEDIHIDDTVRLACGGLADPGYYRVVRLDVRSIDEGADYASKSDVVVLSDGRRVYKNDARTLPNGVVVHVNNYDDELEALEAEEDTFVGPVAPHPAPIIQTQIAA